jgi:hypothetical protein
VYIDTNASISSTDKQNNHLILLGPPDKNSIIEEVNANHTEVGMPVYFASGKMYDDDTDAELSAGANLLEACDNPFNNADVTDAWKDSSQTVWIASGVSDANAKESAEWLINRTCLLEDASDLDGNGFWQVQYMCGDADGDGDLTTGDAMLVLDDAIGIQGRTVRTEWAGDADGDGDLTTGDAMLVLDDAIGIQGRDVNCCGCV